MKNLWKFAVVLVVAFGLATAAQATIVFEESFDYPEGDLVGNMHPDGPIWYGDEGGMPVVADGLEYPGVITSGGAVEQLRPAARLSHPGITQMAETPGTWYFSFLVEGKHCAGVDPGAVVGYGLDWTSYTAAGAYVYITDTAGGEIGGLYADPGVDGEVHLFAWRYINNGAGEADQLDLAIDPDTAAPDWGAPLVSQTLDFTNSLTNVLRLDGTQGAAGPYGLVDEFRIATTFEESIGVPEPATLCLLGLGDLTLLRRRR